MSIGYLSHLRKEQEKELYGYNALWGIPEAMHFFKIGHMEHPLLTSNNPGQYVLVGVEPADIEQHHQVYVIDEHIDTAIAALQTEVITLRVGLLLLKYVLR